MPVMTGTATRMLSACLLLLVAGLHQPGCDKQPPADSPTPPPDVQPAPEVAPAPQPVAEAVPVPEPEPEPEPVDPYAVLSAEQQTIFLSGEADAPIPTEIHYVKSNESRHDVWFPYIDGIAGAYVGVGSDQNYTVLAKARSELAFLLDIDIRVVYLHRIYEVLIEASQTPEQLHERFEESNQDDSLELLTAAFKDFPEKERTLLLRYYRASRETVYRHLRHVIRRNRDGEQSSWLSNPEMYAHVRKLFQNDRIRAMPGDLAGANSMQTVGKVAAELDVPVRVVYLSNAEEYFRYTQNYRNNIRNLKGDDKSVVLRTIYDKEWIHADSLWAYQVQRLSDFQTRLDDTKNRSRNPMFRYATQEKVLDRDTGVKGLSLLGVGLERPETGTAEDG